MNPTPELVRAIAHFFSSSIRTLDKSTSGWWRFIVVMGFLWFFASTYNVAQKVDPMQVFEGKRPEHDCPVIDGRWNCDR